MRKTTLTMRLWRDQDGGPLVEAAILIPFLFVFLLGSVDFLNAFNQWNQATKAVEVGARIAAVSDPVASGLNTIPCGGDSTLCSGVSVGATMPDFQVTCDGRTQLCNCTRGTCTGMGSYTAAKMNLIIFGRESSGACAAPTSYYTIGMCNIFPAITASNVKIVYSQTGLGYAGRVAGPVPTITVSLERLPFQFFFLNGLLGFANVTIPALGTTITGEALSSASQ
jgi:hypothetical protein